MKYAATAVKLARAVYRNIRGPELPFTSYDEFKVFEKGNAYAVVIKTFDAIYIAFRGTNDCKDWASDLKYAKRNFPAGGRVHRGFYKEYRKLQNAIHECLEGYPEHLPIIVCGHSLGGAMAQIQAAWLWHRPLVYLYTFGSPRVGNAEFCELITPHAWHFEAYFDVVTHVPTRSSPFQIIHAFWNKRMPSLYRQPGKIVSVKALGHSINGYVREVLGL